MKKLGPKGPNVFRENASQEKLQTVFEETLQEREMLIEKACS